MTVRPLPKVKRRQEPPLPRPHKPKKLPLTQEPSLPLAGQLPLPEPGIDFSSELDNMHVHLATHGHPSGQPWVKPGSDAAFEWVKKTFKDVQIENPHRRKK